MGEEAYADLWEALRDPAVVHGMVEDYRAGVRIDREHEEADRAAGRRVECPMLLLAAEHDDIDIHGDPRGDLAAVGGRAGRLRARSTPATTRPRRRRSSWPRRSLTSSRRSSHDQGMQVFPTSALTPSNFSVELQGVDAGRPGVSLILVKAAPAPAPRCTRIPTRRS